jgi:hypothetical protein
VLTQTLEFCNYLSNDKETLMLKNMGFVMLTGAVMAVFFSPIYIEAESTVVRKEFVKKDKEIKKKKKCPCEKSK